MSPVEMKVLSKLLEYAQEFDYTLIQMLLDDYEYHNLDQINFISANNITNICLVLKLTEHLSEYENYKKLGEISSEIKTYTVEARSIEQSMRFDGAPLLYLKAIPR